MCAGGQNAVRDGRDLDMDFNGISYWESQKAGYRVEIYHSPMREAVILHCDGFFIKLATREDMKNLVGTQTPVEVISTRARQWLDLIEEVRALEAHGKNL